MSAPAKTDVWMPLYVADYLADTTRLTTIQHGAYLLLIMDYWRNGALPDDDSILAQITKMQPDAWSIARASLERFFSIEQGCWVHLRIEQEKQKAGENSQKAHDRAVKAAQARWENVNSSSNATSNASSNAQAMLDQCPSPSPSPSPLTTTTPTPSQGKASASAILASLGVDPAVSADWVQLRKTKKAAITKTAIEGMKREADKAGISLNDAMRICCERGWAGFNASWDWKPAGKKFSTKAEQIEAFNAQVANEFLGGVVEGEVLNG